VGEPDVPQEPPGPFEGLRIFSVPKPSRQVGLSSASARRLSAEAEGEVIFGPALVEQVVRRHVDDVDKVPGDAPVVGGFFKEVFRVGTWARGDEEP
jgi:hypothetical protein